MATVIDWTRWGQYKRAIEETLVDGFAPIREIGGRGGCVAEATRRLRASGLNIDDTRLGSWIYTQERRAARGQQHNLPDWTLYRRPAGPALIAEARIVRRWLLTAAQNETPVHAGFWNNLRAFAAYLGAEIVVAPFTYQLAVFTDHTARHNVFAEAVRPFLRFESLELGNVVFCAEMNTLPTATRPLSGLHSYTRGRSGVFPHAKVALESIPSMPGTATPIIMTTGSCTVENYIEKKAGLKARFHHVVGATIVEMDSDGRTFCRQVNASDDGSFQDLDLLVRDGNIVAGQRVEGITWGDIHCRKLDPVVAATQWGFDTDKWQTTASDSMFDRLRPRYQFFHDTLDFESRNRHTEDNPHERYRLHVAGKESLEAEIAEAAGFMRATEREWCRSVLVESNHDLWIEGWLAKADYRKDPVNALFFLRMQLAAYESRARVDEGFSIFRHAMRQADPGRLNGIEFCPENGSFVICHESGGIECGSHGHLGANGSRGSAAGLLKVAMKMNRGHEHACSIFDGVYTAGVSGRLNMGYNKGPSSWSHSNIITYPSGKRTILTIQDGKWRA